MNYEYFFMLDHAQVFASMLVRFVGIINTPILTLIPIIIILVNWQC
jgi:hypothetical protein